MYNDKLKDIFNYLTFEVDLSSINNNEKNKPPVNFSAYNKDINLEEKPQRNDDSNALENLKFSPSPISGTEEKIKNRNTQQKVRKSKHKRHRRKNLKKIILISMIVLLVIVALLFIVLNITSNKNDLRVDSSKISEGKVIYYNNHKYVFNENLTTILMIGYDKRDMGATSSGNGQADYLVLYTLDVETGKIKALSIPRDTMISASQIPGAVSTNDNGLMQLALTYNYGNTNDEACQTTTTAVSRLIYNMPIKYYLSLNLNGIAPLNDAAGGVVLKPTESIPNSAIKEGEEISLMGKEAYLYVQYRNTQKLTSALDRQNRQMQYVRELVKQIKQKKDFNLGTILSFYNISKKYLTTNLSIQEINFFAQQLLDKGLDNFEIHDLKGEMKQGPQYAEYYVNQTNLYESMLDLYYIMEY